MNKKKIIGIITIIALMVTSMVPALGAGGDEIGEVDWPGNINISNSKLETDRYTLGQVKEFEIGYYPDNSGEWDVNRHISISGPAEVTQFEYYENEQWKGIESFESKITITTSTMQKVRVVFNEEGMYTIRFWTTLDNGDIVKESKRDIYVSNDGIYIRPVAPSDLKESDNKFTFEWKWNSDIEVMYNLYIDGEKVNENEIDGTRYDATVHSDRFTIGIHTVSVTSVLVKTELVNDDEGNNTIKSVKSKVESEPITIEYVVEEQTSETTTAQTQTTEKQTTTAQAQTTEKQTTTAQIQTTTEQSTTTVQTTTEVPTSSQVTTGKNDVTTKFVATIKPAKAKIKSAVKKKTARNAKIKLKRVSKAVGYQIQICRNKKFKKKNTITKTSKKLSVTVKRLRPNSKYYVRARAYVMNKRIKVFGNWSRIVKVKIKK